LLSAKPEVAFILTTAPVLNIFNVKYLEKGERYNVGLKGSEIGKENYDFDWHHDL